MRVGLIVVLLCVLVILACMCGCFCEIIYIYIYNIRCWVWYGVVYIIGGRVRYSRALSNGLQGPSVSLESAAYMKLSRIFCRRLFSFCS